MIDQEEEERVAKMARQAKEAFEEAKTSNFVNVNILNMFATPVDHNAEWSRLRSEFEARSFFG